MLSIFFFKKERTFRAYNFFVNCFVIVVVKVLDKYLIHFVYIGDNMYIFIFFYIIDIYYQLFF